MDRKKHAELLMAMNDKLNKLIDTEVGEDVDKCCLAAWMAAGWRHPLSMTCNCGKSVAASEPPAPTQRIELEI